MDAQMQQGTFTHGKCLNCGYLGMIGNFQQSKENKVSSEHEECKMEMYRLVLICPMCGDEFCEALFANEVN